MKYTKTILFITLFFLLCSIIFFYKDLLILGILFMWISLSGLYMTIAYFKNKSSYLGKNQKGERPFFYFMITWPFTFAMKILRIYQHLFQKEDSWNEIIPSLFLGRIPYKKEELPQSTKIIVDMTSEFIVPKKLRHYFKYYCLPTLDGLAPDKESFQNLIQTLLPIEEPIYIHCAAGHARSATFLAALLIERKVVSSINEAEKLMQNKRPRVKLSIYQKEFLKQLYSLN